MIEFPAVEQALEDPNGLLASGGNLDPETLLQAYSRGIFPWFEDDQPILWWSPNPRATIKPNTVHVSRSLQKTLRKRNFKITMNRCFSDVIEQCATLHQRQSGTWITDDMTQAYIALHQLGYAHSIEIWEDHNLVGGLYGVAFDTLFCGESMFHRQTDASKVAFVALCKLMQTLDVALIDCQIENPHLVSLGVSAMPRWQFQRFLPQINESKLMSTQPDKQTCSTEGFHAIYPRLSSGKAVFLPWTNSVELLATLR